MAHCSPGLARRARWVACRHPALRAAARAATGLPPVTVLADVAVMAGVVAMAHVVAEAVRSTTWARGHWMGLALVPAVLGSVRRAQAPRDSPPEPAVDVLPTAQGEARRMALAPAPARPGSLRGAKMACGPPAEPGVPARRHGAPPTAARHLRLVARSATRVGSESVATTLRWSPPRSSRARPAHQERPESGALLARGPA
jgi:hypothetical protein